MVSRGASEVNVPPSEAKHSPGVIGSYGGYRAPQGMLSWALHRISGLGILAFLLLHIVDIFLIGYGPKSFNDLVFIYKNPVFKAGEILLIGAVYYHAANGVRIILIDFWEAAYKYERQLYWAAVIVFLGGWIPTSALMIIR